MNNKVNNKTVLSIVLLVAAFWIGFQVGSSDIDIAGDTSADVYEIVPDSVILPINWGSTGKELADSGVVDMDQFEKLYENRGGLPTDIERLFSKDVHSEVIMTSENSPMILNILWAFGLANESKVLEEGEMVNPRYGGAGRFAATGGWTLSSGDAMDHYSTHELVKLSGSQEKLVAEVADNIYRPCCGNPTSFPDCNHGMAMLGLLELMAENGVSESEMYDTALKVNALWFPNVYETIAKYLAEQNTDWENVEPKELLGRDYSSASGYQRVVQAVGPSDGSGASCGV